MRNPILTIAGFDPSGGAGLQADLRVFEGLGFAGLSAAAALTVQDSRGVLSVSPVPARTLRLQLEAIFSDAAVGAVKIGMLGGARQVRAVAAAIKRHRPPHVVLDPVLASTGGVPLLDKAGRKALVEELLPLCDLVTPNIEEAAALAGSPVADAEAMIAAGETILGFGPRAVLIKGGHLPGPPDDILLCPGREPLVYPGERIPAVDAHGTGCALSSAIAAHLASGHNLDDSIRRAKGLVALALRSPVRAGKGRGYPDILAAIRGPEAPHAGRLAKLRGLYVLADPAIRHDRGPEAIAREALAGGAGIIQLRDKRSSTRALTRSAAALCGVVQARGALFIVNDRADVALACGADGAHLGPDDMAPADARRVLGPDRLVGVSVSTVEEAASAAPYASYFGVGAVFGSKTKRDAGAPVGPGRVREIKEAFPRHPVVAIGGINEGNVESVMRAGADAAAVVSAVVCAPDMRLAARRLAELTRKLSPNSPRGEFVGTRQAAPSRLPAKL